MNNGTYIPFEEIKIPKARAGYTLDYTFDINQPVVIIEPVSDSRIPEKYREIIAKSGAIKDGNLHF